MARTVQQLKAALSDQGATPEQVRLAAAELAEIIELFQSRLFSIERWMERADIHTHFFAFTDTNGRQREAQYGTAAPLPAAGNPTTIALDPDAAIGQSVGLSRPRKDM